MTAADGLAGLRVAISGAGSGIGAAVALAAQRAGADTILVDRDETALAATAERLRAEGGSVRTAAADVTDADALRAALSSAIGDGPLHGAVAAAGISGRFGISPDGLTAEDFASVYRVNVIGAFLFVQQALPALRRAPDAGVVLMGSDSGFVAAPGMMPYIASKGAVRQLTAALSVELAAEGIRVNSVCPSVVDTPMARDDLGDDAFAEPGFPVLDPGDVAYQVLHLLSPRSRGVNGTSVVCDFGYMARSGFPA